MATNLLNLNKLDKLAKGLLKLDAVKHKRPKDPTKADLNIKFVMRINKKGSVEIAEVVKK